MKLAKAISVSSTVVLLAFGIAGANAATELPFADGFENGWSGTDPWTNAVGGTIAATAAAKLGGGFGLSISNTTATLDITPATYNNVWIQVYAKPVPGDTDPSDPSGVSGAFYLTDLGDLRVYTGEWVTVASDLPTGQYLGFTIHADYSADEWDIYYTPDGYKTGMEKLNGAPLKFATTADGIESVSIESGDEAYVDAVAVSDGYDALGAANVKAAEFGSSAQYEFQLPAYPDAYTVSSGNLLSALAGDHLRAGLLDSDLLIVHGKNAPTEYDQYKLNGSREWIVDPLTPAAPAPSARAIQIATRLFLDTTGPRDTTWGFWPYNSDVVAVDGVAQPGASDESETVSLNGNQGGHSGFTAIEWVMPTANVNSIDLDGGVPGCLEPGDQLFVAVPNNPNAYTRYVYSGSEWYKGSQVASDAVPGASKMWLRRGVVNGPVGDCNLLIEY